MAIISVLVGDGGRETTHWSVPEDNLLNMSPIPRGIRDYGQTNAIAALGAGDETNVVITLSFPTAFMYLPKSLSISFRSDDLTTEFSNLGSMQYQPRGNAALGIAKEYVLLCGGASFFGAAQSIQAFHPVGTWREWVRGPDLDSVSMRISDISGDTSTAGDVYWTASFWEFDVEQCLNYPVNTPLPTVAY